MTCKTAAAPAPPDRPSRPHLRAALASILTVVLVLSGVEAYTRYQLPRRLNFFAREMNSAKMLGNVVQTAAFRTPGVLPIYGSSELRNPADYRAEEFFLSHPEGLRVFPMGRPGNTCLLILEKLAAAGPAVRGKKVGIFLSPTWFLREDIHDPEVQDNITPLQLGAWMLDPSLGADFKRRFARRLLEHTQALDDPLATVSLRCLAAEPSAANRAAFALLAPVNFVRNAWLTRVDYWTALHDLLFLRTPSQEAVVKHRWRQTPAPLEEGRWELLADKAEAYDRLHAHGTPYSVHVPTNEVTANRALPNRHPGGGRDRNFGPRLERSKEWEDLALLLDGLKELGADAVFISQPFNGLYRDMTGGGVAARRRFYDKLAAAVRPSGYPLMDFSAYEEDKFFFNDSNHPSAKAWIYYDHALDDFYHGRGSFAAHKPS